jgi:predicted  nucleic acid-binding Zn-ribbon protein
LEIQNRTLEEELSTNKENYENLKKRYELLQNQFVDTKKQYSSKSGMFDWILNSNVKEENLQLKEKFEALQSELDLKISENGMLFKF